MKFFVSSPHTIEEMQQHPFLNDPFHTFMFKDNEHLPHTSDFDHFLGASASTHGAVQPPTTTTTMRMTRSRSALQMSSLIAHQQQQQQQESNTEKDNTNPVVPSGWKVIHMDNALLGDDCHFRLTIRSKGEQETSTLPENLYSSIKYHIRHCVSGSFLKNNSIEQLLVRLQIVDPNTLYEMKQNNKPIVRGVVESACLPPHKQKTNSSKKQQKDQQPVPVNDDEISTSMKIQLTSCSYHHSRAKFAIMASYYRNSYQEQPIMVVISSPFLCFARKPQMKKTGSRRRVSSSSSAATSAATDSDIESGASHRVKRRRSVSSTENIDGIYSDDECPNTVRVDRTLVDKYKEVEAKKARYAHQAAAQFPTHSEQFKNFVASLEELFDSFPNASDSERTEASSLVVRKLLQLTDCEDQSYVDQHLSLHSPEPNSLNQTTNMQSQFSSFPSSASYSSLLALTEQQLSPFDITEQLVSDDMSSTTASASIIYSLTGASDI